MVDDTEIFIQNIMFNQFTNLHKFLKICWFVQVEYIFFNTSNAKTAERNAVFSHSHNSCISQRFLALTLQPGLSLEISEINPSLRSRPKLVYDQTQSSAHPGATRPKLQGLEGSSSALQSGLWSGDGLIRGRFGLKSLIIGGFERTWV